MAGILMPKKRSVSEILPIAGGAVGAYFGGPQGAMTGFSAGSMIKGPVDSMFGMDKGAQASASSPQGDAVSRRLETLKKDPIQEVRTAQSDLKAMPDYMQQQYGPALDEAYKRALARQRGVA